jgi:hypothetical protein
MHYSIKAYREGERKPAHTGRFILDERASCIALDSFLLIRKPEKNIDNNVLIT